MIETAKADAKKQKEMFRMQLGEVIRKYRKDKNMTQEEMAVRLESVVARMKREQSETEKEQDRKMEERSMNSRTR